MQSVLALHSDPRLDAFLARAASPEFTFRVLPLLDCKSEDQLVQILPTHVRLADSALVDLSSLQIVGKWVLAWLRTHQPELPVIVRLHSDQLVQAELSPDWTFVFQNDPIERVRQIINTYLSHRHMAQEVQFLREAVNRRSPATAARPAWPPAGEASPNTTFRDAFVNLTRLLGTSYDVRSLTEQVVSLLREMFGIGRLAIFVREKDVGLVKTTASGLPSGRCVLMAGVGISRDLLRNFSLSLEGGIGRQAATQARIVRRDAMYAEPVDRFDPHIAKEFQILGTEFAVPVLDRDTTLGVLTFDGKVTGEPFTNKELELVFNLMNQLGMMITNIWLHQDVSGQQSFLQDLLTHIQSGVVVADSRRKISALNRRAAELLGLSQTSAIGADLSWLPSQVGDLLFQTCHSGQMHQQREVALPQSGRVLSVSTSQFHARADESRGESSTFSVAVIEDITQLKQQHAQARQLEQQEFVLQLASRLSHELKNSLVSINTFAQLLPQQYDRKEFRDEFFKIVAHEVTRVDLLVENLTFFAHPLVLRYEEVDLGELLDNTVTRVVDEFKRQHGSAVVSTTGGQPTITSTMGQPIIVNKRFGHSAKKVACDPRRLSLAIHNMMFNAIQSMPSGGRLSLLTDDAKPNGHAEPRVQISVVDTGEGISLAHIEQVFQPFFTTRNVGVGLGLTISQKIIQRHGGHIAIESKLGKGTSMIVTLPITASPAPDETPSPQEETPAAPPAKNAPRPREMAART